ncbi:TPA: hypothetical protein ACX3HX_004441 [Raoultella ornithinolytica]
MKNENEVMALVATLEKCREVSGCPEGVDLQDHLRQLAAHRESRQNALGNFREGGQMSKHELINIEASTITRGDVVQVWDEEGEKCFSFPATLSDAEVKAILRQVNAAYATGFECGSFSRARSICRELGVKPSALEDAE